jgi:hypothetical protein
MPVSTETPLIMMVAQAPFETPDMNQFCKLIPVAYVDGVRPHPGDFPNDGEIWWMLTGYTSHLAEPGQLLVGTVEFATRYVAHDPVSSRFQVVRDSIQPLKLDVGFEVLALAGHAVENIEDVVVRGFILDLTTPPTRAVMFHWRSHFYGPFHTAGAPSPLLNGSQAYSFSPAHSDGLTIYEFDEKTFAAATTHYRTLVEDTVSLSNGRRRETYEPLDVRHDLVLAAGYERLLAHNPHRLVIEPLERKLQRFSKNCLTRGKRQQLKLLLEELEITGRETENAQDLVQAIARARNVTEKQDASLNAVAEALLRSGLMGEDRITRAEKSFAQKYVEDRTAELQAKVDESIATKRSELRKLEEEFQREDADLLKEKATRRARLDEEIATERQKALQQLAGEKEEFTQQKAELERQQGLLRQNLEKVTKDLREAGDEVVNRFLTIAPLLGVLTPTLRPKVVDQESPVVSESVSRPPGLGFEMPPYIFVTPAADITLKEDVFFERFKLVVQHSGFTFRLLDLQRFHLSVKCGDLTILGGPSGTGKSSLPALYAHALLGDELSRLRPGCLMVNINPSWMDTRDLLGHMNTLDGRFYPAESGLFHHLVYAQKEHEIRGSATGIYLACLDEMNLSQVEHYFSDFMMVLERSGSARKIRCFSPETAVDSCPFKEWGELILSPALRFVGTVNFDETTRLLSDRFLDRVNLIRLTTGGLPGPAAARGVMSQVPGRMVNLADLDSWCSESALPAELGTLLDQMRPMLAQMGCPISPRVYRGLCRFVASSQPILTQEKAFDVQVCQRIIPRIRSLVTDRQIDALEQLIKLLNQSNACSFEESLPLLEESRNALSGRKWDLEA